MQKEIKKLKLKEYIKYFKEEFNVSAAVKEIIETKWSQSNDVGKAISLLKGLAFSNDPKAKMFIKDLDDITSNMDEKKYL